MLKVGEDRSLSETEGAALRLLSPHGLPVPELLGVDLPAVLTTCLPGTSRTTAALSPVRLRALGAAAALVHAVPLPDTPLPERDRPIPSVDFAVLRRKSPARPLLVEAEAVLAAIPAPGARPHRADRRGRRRPAAARAAERTMADLGIDPTALAGAIAFAIDQPHDVEIGDLTIRPTRHD